MAQLITVFWRDIPAQVIARERRKSEKVQLGDWFSVAIDAAAMRANMIGTDAYLEQWKRVSRPCGDDLKAEAEAAAREIEQSYDKARLKALIRNAGIEPE